MKVCVLQASYERSDILRDHAQYDPPRDLSHLAPEWSFTNLFLHKATVYNQLRDAKKQGFDLYVNLCEGHATWDIAGVDVIHALDSLDLPYTGPRADLYEPRKDALKLVARYAGVRTPRFAAVSTVDEVAREIRHLRFPLFVKPNGSGDSWGIDAASYCNDLAAVQSKTAELLTQNDSVLIEEFLGGREFSALVAADPDDPKNPLVYPPVEFRFPDGESFKTYELKNTRFLPDSNARLADAALEAAVKKAAQQFFVTYGAAGYCRMDFRLDQDGAPNILDANFTCSVFYPDGYYGTADYILKLDSGGAPAFFRHIVREGVARWKARHAAYVVRNDGLSGLGIEAARAIGKGEVVFKGEERSQRIATRRWVEANWTAEEKIAFAQYAYPLDEEVFILWSDDPMEWAPQNHSCDPNCGYDGLNVVALRDIAKGDELTLDYADFCSETSAEFPCACGAANCRGYVKGSPGNSVALREQRRRLACSPAS